MNYTQQFLRAFLLFGSITLYGAQKSFTQKQSFFKKSMAALTWILITQPTLVQSQQIDNARAMQPCENILPGELAFDLCQFNEKISHKKYMSSFQKDLLETLAQENLERIQAIPTIKEVKGDLFLVFHNPYYITDEYRKFSHRICDEEGYLIPLAQNDVLISVWATSSPEDTSDVISGNWANHGHPLLGKALTFPEYLPLSLLDGKKEGDLISFFFKNEQDEIVQIELTCKQLAYRYSFASFEDALIGIKAGFAQQPFVNSWLVDDAYVAPYIQSGLVEEYIDDAGKVAFRHGPNGFRLSN